MALLRLTEVDLGTQINYGICWPSGNSQMIQYAYKLHLFRGRRAPTHHFPLLTSLVHLTDSSSSLSPDGNTETCGPECSVQHFA